MIKNLQRLSAQLIFDVATFRANKFNFIKKNQKTTTIFSTYRPMGSPPRDTRGSLHVPTFFGRIVQEVNRLVQ